MSQLALELHYRPALGRDDFWVAPANAEAVKWLDLWPSWPGPALAIAGPAGSGKTHLGHVFAARSGAVLVAGEALASAAELGAAARAVIVDDADRADAETLLHLYNMLAERGLHLLVLAREAPARWGIALADLRSRLLTAPVASLALPDDTLLAALLLKLFADRQMTVGEGVIPFILQRIERSFAAAAAIVPALDQAALAGHRPVTVALARAVLGER
jgi:chromosomal replication initiation ATPase DnaA